MSQGNLIPKNKSQANIKNQSNQNMERMSMTGKTEEEMLPFLLSGESDDLSFDMTKE